MFISNEKLKKILTKAGIIDEKTWDDALKNAQRLTMPIEDVLKERDIIAGHYLYELVSQAIGLPYVNLKRIDVEESALSVFDNEIVGRYKAIPYSVDRKKRILKVAFLDPTNAKNIKALERKVRMKIIPAFMGQNSFKFASRYYQKNVADSIKKLIEKLTRNTLKKTKQQTSHMMASLFEKILEYVYYTQPSDIHIEHLEKNGSIKFRIDGFLHDEFFLPLSFLEGIGHMIKQQANIKTDSLHQARDGRFSTILFDEILSFRVSTLPTYYGEKICLRVLDESRQKTSLRDLGFREENIDVIKQETKKPYGLILVTGPTGSGKSSTLYTILKSLNVEGISIATIEDPIEYSIKHINQTQVNLETGFTFVQGLRAILRQDPNVIMVGEIRDNETSAIAIQSALTGHIVLSTLHSNTAAGAVTRLRNMDARSYLLSSTVSLIISQRLVKGVCPYCRESYPLNTSLLETMSKDAGLDMEALFQKLKSRGQLSFETIDDIRFYRGKGCMRCKGQGMIGRIGVFEILQVDDEIKRMILAEKSESQIQKTAIEKGMFTFFEDGLLKVFQGETTIEEIMRILN